MFNKISLLALAVAAAALGASVPASARRTAEDAAMDRVEQGIGVQFADGNPFRSVRDGRGRDFFLAQGRRSISFPSNDRTREFTADPQCWAQSGVRPTPNQVWHLRDAQSRPVRRHVNARFVGGTCLDPWMTSKEAAAGPCASRSEMIATTAVTWTLYSDVDSDGDGYFDEMTISCAAPNRAMIPDAAEVAADLGFQLRERPLGWRLPENPGDSPAAN